MVDDGVYRIENGNVVYYLVGRNVGSVIFFRRRIWKKKKNEYLYLNNIHPKFVKKKYT